MKTPKRIVRIFQEPDGKWYICDDSADCLDARGYGWPTRAAARYSLRYTPHGMTPDGEAWSYTHIVTGDGRVVRLTRPRRLSARSCGIHKSYAQVR